MPSIEQIIQLLFDGNITLDKIAALIVAVYAFVMSIANLKINSKAITAERNLSGSEQEVIALREQTEHLKQAVGMLGDIVVTAFLASPATNITTKKAIATSAEELAKLANIDFSKATAEILNTVTTYIPGSTLVEKKEEILTAVTKAEQLVDAASEQATNLVNKLKI